MCIPNLLITFSVDGHFGSITLCVLLTILLGTWVYKCLFEALLSISLGLYSEIEFLDHMVFNNNNSVFKNSKTCNNIVWFLLCEGHKQKTIIRWQSQRSGYLGVGEAESRARRELSRVFYILIWVEVTQYA